MRKLVPVLMCCLTMTTGAVAREVVVTGGDGLVLSLSPENLYRALGDRIVTGNDAIGNNAVDWNRIDSSLPVGRIALNLPDDVDEARVLGVVRLGCELAGGTTRACDRVGLRRDRIMRQGGGFFDDGGMAMQRALIREQRLDREAERRREMNDGTMMGSVTGRVESGSASAVPMSTGPGAGASGMSDPTVAVPAPAFPVPEPEPATAFVTEAPAPKPAPPPVLEDMPGVVIPAMTKSSGPPPVVDAGSATVSPVPVRKQGRVYASRLFTGREGFPPEAFAAYGIVAFSTLATSEDRDTYMAICEAFFSALINSGDIEADASEQMVTVWPVDDRGRPELTASLNTTRAREGSCENAVRYYDVQVARGAIGEAMQAGVPLSGRGPFLLAWAPAGMKGSPDAVVLAADLGDVKTVADAKDVLRIWREDIEQDPELWQNGFSVEKLRVKLRLIVDRYGEGLLRFLGG